MTNPDLLRAEARKCRYFAEAISDSLARDELLKLADDYDDRATLLDSERDGEVS